jgi:transforming growth factor-beta-induced protein
MKILIPTVLAFAVVALVLGSARAAEKPNSIPPAKPLKQPFTEVLAHDPEFSTLAAALKTTELLEQFTTKGYFMVFAPTNKAFAKIPKATLEPLLANKTELTKLLNNHMLSGKNTKFTSVSKNGDVTMDMPSLLGNHMAFKDNHSGAVINGIKIIRYYNTLQGSTIFVIDTLLMPK